VVLSEGPGRPRAARRAGDRRRPVTRAPLGLAVLLVLLPLLGAVYEAAMSAYDAWRSPAPGRLVAVDGRRMHLHCTGDGRPTVILDAGLGGWSLDWSLVQPEIARFTRVCAYDRAGLGWSDPGPAPRDAQQAVRELHDLLAESPPGPLLLVGHSNGGLRVLLYAGAYPEEVAGLVLVDPTPLATDEEGLNLLTPGEQEELQTLVPATAGGAGGGGLDLFQWMHRLRPFGVPRLLAASFLEQSVYGRLHAGTRPAYLATVNNGSFYATFVAETEQRQRSIEQVRRMGGVGDVPLAVLASSTFRTFHSDPPPPGLPERFTELNQKMLWELAVATSRMSPQGTVERVPQSGHYVMIDRPDAVAQAVQRMVEARRRA
jgi:pimeloyl-ACP methyl ester carboxylesterase